MIFDIFITFIETMKFFNWYIEQSSEKFELKISQTFNIVKYILVLLQLAIALCYICYEQNPILGPLGLLVSALYKTDSCQWNFVTYRLS